MSRQPSDAASYGYDGHRWCSYPRHQAQYALQDIFHRKRCTSMYGVDHLMIRLPIHVRVHPLVQLQLPQMPDLK
jgi:hypothetical protein